MQVEQAPYIVDTYNIISEPTVIGALHAKTINFQQVLSIKLDHQFYTWLHTFSATTILKICYSIDAKERVTH